MDSKVKQESEQKSKQYFQYGNKTAEYLLIRSRRRKTSEITVDRKGITVRVPLDKSIQDVQNILNDKARWIATKQKDFQDERLDIVIPTYQDKSALPYLGINYELNVFPLFREDYVEKFAFDGCKFIASIHPHNKKKNQDDKIKNLYLNWLVLEANKIFHKKVEKYSKIVNVKPKQIIIKNLVNRWGSVTKKESINLNVNLVKAPDDIIDYIIIHELCHFVIKGHSYRFWDYVKQFVPDYKQNIRWLDRNTSSLLVQ